MAQLVLNIRCSVGVETLDGQHATLLRLFDDLHTSTIRGELQNAPGELLQELKKHTYEHFSFEEKMLAATNYPGLARHCTQHRDLARLVDELTARYERGGRVNIHLLRYIGDWFTRHIELEDKEYAPWLNRHGVC